MELYHNGITQEWRDICVAAILLSSMSYELKIYFNKTLMKIKMVKGGANIPQVEGWGYVVEGGKRKEGYWGSHILES